MASLENHQSNAVGASLVAQAGMPFHLEIDETARIIRASSHGFWTLDQAEDYVAELSDLVEDCRRRFGRVRVLADRRGSMIQSTTVSARLGEAHAGLFAETDRLAIVVATSVAKGQLRRWFAHAGSQAFLSCTAAELWLSAWA